MSYAVYATENFEKAILKLNPFDKKIVEKFYLKLKENPYIGDMVKYNFFREKSTTRNN
jgi:mRNA-degrading endonuclease RelE of RelBE toxin-antitoxin system